MSEAALNVGEQAEISFAAPDRAAGRRPWHPSKGGAPWDREESLGEKPSPFLDPKRDPRSLDWSWNQIHPVVDCDCTACRREPRP
jgi:hypothetical protein